MFKTFFIGFVLLITLLLSGTLYYKYQIKEEKIYNIMDQLSLTLQSEIKSHMMDDLELALILSSNKALVDALENDDEDLGYKILSTIVMDIKKHTNRSLRAQVITNEYNIFARSWDDIYAGMPIGDYRKDLEYFNSHTTPRTSLEIGRRLGFKSTVPIYKDGVFLGFLEVISFFKSMTEFFSSMGVDVYVLLDVDYMDTAVLMMENLTIDKYVVANRDYNSNHIQTLKKINFKDLALNNTLHVDNKHLFYNTMYDGSSQAIGAFVFVLPERYLEYFRDYEDDISFLVNITRSRLYDMVKEENYEKNIYDEYSANSMLYLDSTVSKEDRQMFLDEAYNKFDKFTKDELIQMMLERKKIKKIDGKIK